MKNTDYPITEPLVSVSPWVKKDNPGVKGLIDTCSTPQTNGGTSPGRDCPGTATPVVRGSFNPTEVMDRASFPRDEKNGGVSQQSTKPNIATVSSQTLVQKAKTAATHKSIQLPVSDSPTASNAKLMTRQVTSLEHPVVPGTAKSPVISSPRKCSFPTLSTE